MSASELREYRDIFRLVDRDGGGAIERRELGQLLETLAIDVAPGELDMMIDEVDQDRSGAIDFEEFVIVMSRRVSLAYSAEQVKAAFKVFELKGAPPGTVRADVLLKALSLYGGVEESTARELVAQLESTSDGHVRYGDYVDMLMRR